jgi:hypothetical protein
LEDIPNFYLGEPLDSNEKILELERTGFVDLMDEKEETALMFGGEVVGRIRDLPSTAELIESIILEASEVLETLPKKVLK